MSDSEQMRNARSGLAKIFRYLRAQYQLRNPVQQEIDGQPWVMWFKDLPNHKTVQRGLIIINNEGESKGGDDYILKVSRPQLTNCPEPSLELTEWLEHGWHKIDRDVKLIPSFNRVNDSGDTETIRFEDDLQRKEEFEKWVSLRDQWIEAETPARQAMDIFKRLYDLYARLERESERLELVVGDGLLSFRNRELSINHPILLQRLQLEFDPTIPEFKLSETDQPSELFTALLRLVPEVPPQAISRISQDLEDSGFHPLGIDETTEFFKRVATQISPMGDFVDENRTESARGVPSIKREPVLFLRKRTLGFGVAIDAILEDLNTEAEFPPFMTSIVGVNTARSPQIDRDSSKDLNLNECNGIDEEVLLTKEANAEQLQIAHRLEQHGAVLVQGPPGTGKTHTIANLLSHLLAQGKSILVTSHTAKALKVLREKVADSLQSLCISLLTEDSRTQLEATIDEITDRLSRSNTKALDNEIAVLTQKRKDLFKELGETRQKLLLGRQDEYRPVVFAGEQYKPSDAARMVAEGKDIHDWIPGPVELDVPRPLTKNELVELYQINSIITLRDEQEIASNLPNPDTLITPVEFEELIKRRANLLNEELNYGKELWGGTQSTVDELYAVFERTKRAVEFLQEEHKWQLGAIAAGVEGNGFAESWQRLLNQVDEVFEQATHTRETIIEFGPELPEEEFSFDVEQVLDEILDHLNRGGRLSKLKLFTKREWKVIIQKSQVNRQLPLVPEHFNALRSLARIKSARQRLLDRWKRQVAQIGGPSVDELGSEPEILCRQYCGHIRRCLDWFPNTWLTVKQELESRGFDWDNFFLGVPVNLDEHGNLLRIRYAVLEKLPKLVEAQANRLTLSKIESKLGSLQKQLESAGNNATEVMEKLRGAVKNLNQYDYQSAYRRLVDLKLHSEEVKRRRELLFRLEQVAPSWAKAIEARSGKHGRGTLPGDPEKAWAHRQMDDELNIRSKTSLEELQKQIAELSENLRSITSLLVEKKAWVAQVRRTTIEQRQALQGWKLLMRRIGRGTGIRAPKLQSTARKLMPTCQSAVPVWIMPLSRVVENFDPRRNHFDVVIIDEASQADAMALVALYMGHQVIVVGDHEQVSPVAVGQKQDDVQRVIDEHLQGIPNADLYDGLFSIYDLAMTSFEPICLREHFRCVTPIIQFSNYLSYGGNIKPLRDSSGVKLIPHLISYRVNGAVSRNKVNVEEALTLASLLVSCSEQPEYSDSTFGVISLLGEEQAIYIDSLLQRYLSTEEYKRRRVQCGNSAQFQGDERDVMFLSMVDTATDGPLALRTEGAQDMFKKRFNVAASRARNQLWLVHSLNPDTDLKPKDLRRRLINHAEHPEAIMRLLESQEKRTESEFERLVLKRLTQEGYRVTTQWPVGAYRIDMVVEGAGKRLAVECDGDRWHPLDKLEEDMARQAILERLGWTFVRIRGSNFFRNQEEAMKVVFDKLDKLDILPEATKTFEEEQNQNTELKERVILKASELKRQWLESLEEDVVPQKATVSGNYFKRKDNKKHPEVTAKPVTAADNNPTSGEKNYPMNIETINTEPIEKDMGDDSTSVNDETEDVPAIVMELYESLFGNSNKTKSDSHSPKIPENKPQPTSLKSNSTKTSTQQIKKEVKTDNQFDLISYLASKGVEIVDKRLKGGALWVIGGAELSGDLEPLKSKGVRFVYSKKGGRATKHRPAWYMRD